MENLVGYATGPATASAATTDPEPLAEEPLTIEIAPLFARDPRIRVLLLRIQRIQAELAIKQERRNRGRRTRLDILMNLPAGQQFEWPTWGPCTRCGYKWRGLDPQNPPSSCARCHSRYWQRAPENLLNSRTPDQPPNPRWIVPARQRSVTAATASTSSLRSLPPPPSADSLPSLPSLPAPPRPLADYLVRARFAERQAEQPERLSAPAVPEEPVHVNADRDSALSVGPGDPGPAPPDPPEPSAPLDGPDPGVDDSPGAELADPEDIASADSNPTAAPLAIDHPAEEPQP